MGKNQTSKMYHVIRCWARDESGATALEYALMAGLIAFAIIAGATSLGDALNANYDEAATALVDALPSS